jgi:hypothetical protein
MVVFPDRQPSKIKGRKCIICGSVKDIEVRTPLPVCLPGKGCLEGQKLYGRKYKEGKKRKQGFVA